MTSSGFDEYQNLIFIGLLPVLYTKTHEKYKRLAATAAPELAGGDASGSTAARATTDKAAAAESPAVAVAAPADALARGAK